MSSTRPSSCGGETRGNASVAVDEVICVGKSRICPSHWMRAAKMSKFEPDTKRCQAIVHDVPPSDFAIEGHESSVAAELSTRIVKPKSVESGATSCAWMSV